jgi:hypothetical protein
MASSRRATRRWRVICGREREAAPAPERDDTKLARRRRVLWSAASEDEAAVAVAAVGWVWSDNFIGSEHSSAQGQQLHFCVPCITGTDLIKMTALLF